MGAGGGDATGYAFRVGARGSSGPSRGRRPTGAAVEGLATTLARDGDVRVGVGRAMRALQSVAAWARIHAHAIRVDPWVEQIARVAPSGVNGVSLRRYGLVHAGPWLVEMPLVTGTTGADRWKRLESLLRRAGSRHSSPRALLRYYSAKAQTCPSSPLTNTRPPPSAGEPGNP
jgi:hypothetical protein